MSTRRRSPRASASAQLSMLADIGSAWTKAAVVAQSRGRWRIVAHAAQPTDWGDPELHAALAARLGAAADPRLSEGLRSLVAAAPRIACHTPARPGRLALAAVSSELSGAAARRAAEASGWVVVEAVTADDGRSLADRLASLQAASVDAWLVAGGFEAAATEQALEMAGLVRAARGASPAPVVWAGASLLDEAVTALFEPGTVSTVENPQPSAERSDGDGLRHYLEAMLERIMEPGGARQLAPIAFRRAIGEVARERHLRVVAVDLGARYATWVVADGEGGAESRVFATGGLTASALAGPHGPGRVLRMLPIAIDEMAISDTLQNLGARPGTVPHSDEELAIAHAAARLQLAAMPLADLAPAGVDLVIGAGRTIAGAPNPGLAMQLLLDGLRPVGITQVAIDAAGALSPLGALGEGEIAEGIAELRDDLLVPLGAAVVCRAGRPGQPAMRVSVLRPGWPAVGPIELRAGQLQVLPLGPAQVAEIEVELLGDATIGAPRRTRRVRATVTGGSAGLALDARSAPLLLPRRSDDRRAILAGWRDAFVREPAFSTGRPT